MDRKPIILTLPLLLSLLPAIILFGTMIAGFTSLKNDVNYIKEDSSATKQDIKALIGTVNEMKVDVAVLKNQLQVSQRSSSATVITRKPESSPLVISQAPVSENRSFDPAPVQQSQSVTVTPQSAQISEESALPSSPVPNPSPSSLPLISLPMTFPLID